MKATQKAGLALGALTLVIVGCGGSGSGLVTNFIAMTMTMNPASGFSGNSTPMSGGIAEVNRTATSQVAMIVADGRAMRYTIPGSSTVDGQTFWSGMGGASMEYIEDTDLGRSHGGSHVWLGAGNFTVKRGPGGAVFLHSNNTFLNGTGDFVVISNSNSGSPIGNVEVTPVGENGSISLQNESGFNGTGTDWVGVATFQRLPDATEIIVYTETGGGTRTMYLVLDQMNPYIPQNVNPLGRVVFEETISGIVHRWIGSGGSVVPTITNFPSGQYSINGVLMSPDPMTPATGTVTVNGVIIHL
ncbi:MAG: hypothetical protein KF812_02720 [Fimbriimonadaceae bacterium]|nr:hypothetical protein [Fimbriimonadaceae bacterium]